MKLLKLTTILVVLALFVNFCTSMKNAQKGETGTISGILKEANCPLTGEQEKRLKEFKPGGERRGFSEVYEIFDEKQTDALKEVFGSSPGRDGGPERPRNLFFAVIFENEGCPFTEAQLKQIKALPSGRGAFQQMQEIFTEQQNQIVQSMFNR